MRIFDLEVNPFGSSIIIIKHMFNLKLYNNNYKKTNLLLIHERHS